MAVLPLGVDPERFHPDVAPFDLGDAAPGLRFLFVGGLHARKGVDLLLDAYERAFRRDDDVTLVVKDFGPRGPYPPGRLDERVRRMAAGAARAAGRAPVGARARGGDARASTPRATAWCTPAAARPTG